RFADRAKFLVDFYHVSEYLSAASELLGESKKALWFRQQQRRLKANQTREVIKELTKLEEIEKAKLANATNRTSITKEEQPASACRRYLENRLEYLDYKTALKSGLPISSGETESGHRWVIQVRLKKAGAWWKTDNAERMLKLRTMRASGEWATYWRRVRQAAA
ncbi:MAG TPA: ISKra4 family transposase, partial [Blastocatellia bacterium]|nr:ISKra4 family transposase [Blastocatellia bacterium]